MRIAFTILIAIHGIVHLFGFLKSFNLAAFNGISQPISKPFGILWLAAFILFTVSAILYLRSAEYWWAIGFLAVLISQWLIFAYWGDAKFGTIMNLAILAVAIIAYSTFGFKKKIAAEKNQMLVDSKTTTKIFISEQMISDLPIAVKKWLTNSGLVGRERIESVFLEQNVQLRLNPEQKEWNSATAQQYFTVEPPAFNWSINLKINPLINLTGRDKFEYGKGEMTIRLFSLIPVVNAKNHEKVNQATLQRYLGEIVWFPSAALSPYIIWEAIGENAAKATMTYNETTGSGVFHFDENGNFKKFATMRYKDAKDTQPTEWIVSATKTEMRNGIKIPVEAKADWRLEQGDWTWLKLKITNIAYNIK